MNELKHVWVIMDWNRRYAKDRCLPAVMWHRAWADNVKKVAEIAKKNWIEYLTLWALSTDNLLKRTSEEVSNILKLIDNIEFFLGDMKKGWLKFNTIWDLSKLPEESQYILQKIKDKTRDNVWIILTIGLIYWGQDEIIRWIKKFILSWWDINSLTAESFRGYLDTWDLPSPDLIIRTWWDIRHSWFLLYDSEHSEYAFTNSKWPEFGEIEFNQIITDYKSRERRLWK